MEGLKPMVNKAMGDDFGGLAEHVEQVSNVIQTAKAADSPSFQPLGSYAANPNDYGASNLTPNSYVGLNINGHNLNVTVYRSLQGLADDITNSMLPEEVNMLVRLLGGEHATNPLPDSFWRWIGEGQKIRAIKELRRASLLNLKSSKDIVDAITDPSKGQGKDNSEDDKLRCDFDCDHCHADDDKEESEDSEDKDKSESQDKDDSGDTPEDAEPGDGEDGDQEEGASAGEAAGAEDGQESAVDDNGQEGNATADALAELAKRAHDNGKQHSEEEIRKALATLGIQF